MLRRPVESAPLFSVVVVCLIFDLKFNILSGALRGAGDTTYSMLVNVLSAWLLFVPALLLVTPRYGLIGAWSCFILHVFVMALGVDIRVRGSRWLHRPRHRPLVPGDMDVTGSFSSVEAEAERSDPSSEQLSAPVVD